MFDIYLDEAGYTGPDLINRDQPVYTLAAITLPTEAAQDLAAKCFTGVQAREFKHSRLSHSSRGRRQILDFIHALAGCPDSASVTVAHKECVLLGMLVDFWVEPALRLDGINLYENGANIGLVNVTYLTLGALLGADGRREFLRRFQVMVRDRTIFAHESFWNTVHDLCRDHPRFDGLFGIYEAAGLRLGARRLWELPEHLLDLGDYGLLETVGHWRKKTTDRLQLIHDHATALARDEEQWKVWLSGDAPPAVVGQDRRVIHFPLDGYIQLADSVSHLQIQLADIVAGATATILSARAGRAPRDGDYVRALGESPLLDRFLIGGVWPSDRVRPADLETEGVAHGDAAAYMAALLAQPRRNDDQTGPTD